MELAEYTFYTQIKQDYPLSVNPLLHCQFPGMISDWMQMSLLWTRIYLEMNALDVYRIIVDFIFVIL